MPKFSRVANVLILTGVLLLPGCAALEEQMPILSLLEQTPKPPAMPIRLERLSNVPLYRPISSCTYNVRMAARGAGSQVSHLRLSVQTVRDRLLVTSDDEAGRSTAIISRLGHKFSFNIVKADGSHVSSDRVASLPSSSSALEMNNMDLFTPEYVSGPKQVGDVVSWLQDFRGVTQAAYIYKGLGTYRGREVILLTLVASPNGSRPNLNQAFGFSLVDRGTALPVSFSMRGNPSIKGELAECVN